MDELKACPFCGKLPSVKNVSLPFDAGKPGKIAQCQCGAFLSAGRWNTRPLEDAANARAELDLQNKTLSLVRADVAALRASLAAKDAEIAKRKPIPVSERMPEEQLDVLIFDGLQERWTIGFLVKLSENRYQWATNEHTYWHDDNFGRITHWMPLPEPPEVNDGQA